MPDAVADDQGDATCIEIDDVVPVAADLERSTRREVPHRKSAGQTGGAEHRMLQCHSGFALLIDLVNSLQALTEASCQYRQQRVVFRGELPLFGQFDPDDRRSAQMAQGDARGARFFCHSGQWVAVAQRLDHLPLPRRQFGPPHGLPGAHHLWRHGSIGAGESGDDDAPRLPYPAQLLSSSTQSVIDRI